MFIYINDYKKLFHLYWKFFLKNSRKYFGQSPNSYIIAFHISSRMGIWSASMWSPWATDILWHTPGRSMPSCLWPPFLLGPKMWRWNGIQFFYIYWESLLLANTIASAKWCDSYFCLLRGDQVAYQGLLQIPRRHSRH